jgi:hypothetical protein
MKYLSLMLSGLLLAFTCPGSAQIRSPDQRGETKERTEPSIGVATMEDDGTIVLRLRATTPQGSVGEASLVYPPSHPEYQKILAHIGPIRKGQTVPVRPWPD